MPLQPDALSWTGLLAKWIEFAQGALALPRDAEGHRWRESVVPIINLQAVTFALGDLEQLRREDRPLARDRAAVLIRDNESMLEAIWRGKDMPPMVQQIIRDASRAHEFAAFRGLTELIWPGPGELIIPALELDLEAGGTLLVAQPGTIMMPNEPVAWWADRDDESLPAQLSSCRAESPPHPRQVYREIDDRGRMVRDHVAPIDAEPRGMPLLVPLLECGKRIGHFTMNEQEWIDCQRSAMAGALIPVLQHDA